MKKWSFIFVNYHKLSHLPPASPAAVNGSALNNNPVNATEWTLSLIEYTRTSYISFGSVFVNETMLWLKAACRKQLLDFTKIRNFDQAPSAGG